MRRPKQNMTITFHGGDMMREALMRNQGKILKALSKAVRLHTAKGTRLVGAPMDCGVRYPRAGPLTRVSGGKLRRGQYRWADGVYTFARADAGRTVVISVTPLDDIVTKARRKVRAK